MVDQEKKRMLKEMIRELHSGTPPQTVKTKFKKVLEETSSEDIAKIEQELVKEGMPREELQRLCDVHMAVFADQVKGEELHLPQGHPINILMEEHKILLGHAERLKEMIGVMAEASIAADLGYDLSELLDIVRDFRDSENHYAREENALFPLLEKHGITEPPAIMWMEHNKIREIKKKIITLVEQMNTMAFSDFTHQFKEAAEPVCGLLPNHYFKENTILFPAAIQVVTNSEWKTARKDFDEIGYCCFTPKELKLPFEAEKETEATVMPTDTMEFENGSLTKEEAEAILDTLPIDVSFVDKYDAVKYFNKAEKRIFVRTKSVIGRKVQNCHPEKSVDVVNKIVQSFKFGKRDVAEFWIGLNNRLVLIKYYAIRSKNGEYLGTMEVAQDITDIRKIQGQKRLLDWKE